MANPITFTEEHVKKNARDYPKVSLAMGERALLTVVENPVLEYQHQIQKPVLDEQNNIVMQTKDKKDGTQYQTPKLAWVSTVICLGDPDKLQKDGIDPDACPACARAADGQKGFFPKRRFLVHVIKTATKPGSWEPTRNADKSVNTQVLAWSFTDVIFNKLVEYQSGFGLKTHDIYYGPRTNPGFDTADVNIAPNTVLDEAARANIFTDDSKCEDLSVFAGFRKNKARMEDDLAIVDEAFAKANGTEASTGAKVTSTAALSEGIASLLDDDTTSGATTVSEPVADLDSLVGGSTTVTEEKWADKAPEEEPAAKAAPEPSGKELDVDDILANL